LIPTGNWKAFGRGGLSIELLQAVKTASPSNPRANIRAETLRHLD
jgi:hypothetical protein